MSQKLEGAHSGYQANNGNISCTQMYTEKIIFKKVTMAIGQRSIQIARETVIDKIHVKPLYKQGRHSEDFRKHVHWNSIFNLEKQKGPGYLFIYLFI